MEKCLFCKNDVKISPWSEDKVSYDCPQCGTFSISGSLEASIQRGYRKEFYPKVSSWISEQNIVFNNADVYLDSHMFEQILIQPDKKMKEKFDCVLKNLFKINNNHSFYIYFNHCYTTKEELKIILKNNT